MVPATERNVGKGKSAIMTVSHRDRTERDRLVDDLTGHRISRHSDGDRWANVGGRLVPAGS